MDLLQKRSSFSPYVIKPDLPADVCLREKVLLKERWDLIQSGTCKSVIKIKGNTLLVNGSHLEESIRAATLYVVMIYLVPHLFPAPDPALLQLLLLLMISQLAPMLLLTDYTNQIWFTHVSGTLEAWLTN